MTPQAEDRSAGPAPWAQPPVVGDDGRVVVATGCIDPRDGIVLIDADGVIAGTFLLLARDRIGSGPPAAPGGPSIAPILVGGRTLLAISPGQGSTALDADDTTARPGSIPAALVGSGSSAKDAILAIDASGAPVTGWPLAVPGGGWVTGMRLLPDETLVVLATVDDASKVLVVDPSATGTGE
jgi:hypothetical protein